MALEAGRALAERTGLRASDLSLGPTALSAPYQLVANLVPALSVGATCWVMNNWDAEGGLDVVARLGATVLAADPSVLAQALTESATRPDGPPATLRLVLCGDEPPSAELSQAWGNLGLSPVEIQLP